MTSDADALRRVARGDREAVLCLFQRHATAVYNHCFRRCGDWAVAEDLTSQVFLLWNPMASSAQRAAAFRVLERIPGARALRPRRDPRGRPAAGVRRTWRTGHGRPTVVEYLFTPGSGTLLAYHDPATGGWRTWARPVVVHGLGGAGV